MRLVHCPRSPSVRLFPLSTVAAISFLRHAPLLPPLLFLMRTGAVSRLPHAQTRPATSFHESINLWDRPGKQTGGCPWTSKNNEESPAPEIASAGKLCFATWGPKELEKAKKTEGQSQRQEERMELVVESRSKGSWASLSIRRRPQLGSERCAGRRLPGVCRSAAGSVLWGARRVGDAARLQGPSNGISYRASVSDGWEIHDASWVSVWSKIGHLLRWLSLEMAFFAHVPTWNVTHVFKSCMRKDRSQEEHDGCSCNNCVTMQICRRTLGSMPPAGRTDATVHATSRPWWMLQPGLPASHMDATVHGTKKPTPCGE